MPCYHPIAAWQTDAGEVIFSERGSIRRSLQLPCGRCIGCRLSKARDWSIRCVHEAQLHPVSSFVTLTYGSDHFNPSLDYTDFQLFMKRLRRRLGPTRFFACGEYGDLNKRPHFHALLFGQTFPDKKVIRKKPQTLYRSDLLSSLWPAGHASFGNVTMQSAAYCASYTLKKVSGPASTEHYMRPDPATGELLWCQPEFAHMSLKPAIGRPWFDRFWREVYDGRDGVVVQGKQHAAPKYYDLLLKRNEPELRDALDFQRYVDSEAFIADCTPDRLAIREIVTTARQAHKARQL